MATGQQRWFTGPAEDRCRYVVSDPTPLGSGQGYVFAAEGPEGRVILKLVEGVDAERAAKFLARARRVIEHPHANIHEVLDLFQGPGLFTGAPPPDEECDILVGVARFVEGETLRAIAPLPPEEVVVVVEDVAAGIHHLHEVCGLVHRDLHPSNVLVGRDGHARLIDLATAREHELADGTTTVAGVLGFIAPERTYTAGDRRTDLWGVGMIAVDALLGHPQGDLHLDDIERELRHALAGTARPAKAAAHIRRMIEPDPAARPGDVRVWAAELRRLVTERGDRRRWIAAGVVAAAAAAVVVGVVWSGDDDAPPSESALPGGTAEVLSRGPCSHTFGFAADGVDAERVEAIGGLLESAAAGSCATGPVEAFGPALVQPIESGVVVAGGEPHVAVRLTAAQWTSYQAISSTTDPTDVVEVGGYPIEVSNALVPGATTIRLSRNGIVVGRRDDTQAFWMPDQVLAVWGEHDASTGLLGFPTSNPYSFEGGVRQDFEGGYVEADSADAPLQIVQAASIEVHLVDDRWAPLSDLGPIRGRILRQHTGTAWFVDQQSYRRWIPDDATWECLGGDGNVAIHDAPGWAIATLPLGPPASCE